MRKKFNLKTMINARLVKCTVCKDDVIHAYEIFNHLLIQIFQLDQLIFQLPKSFKYFFLIAFS